MTEQDKYSLPDTPPPAGDTGTPLTRKERREIITPYAFEVCPSLLGVPTASPLRRLLAIGLDGAMVIGLAKAYLICIVPVMAFLAYFRWQAGKSLHVVLLVLFTVGWVASSFEQDALADGNTNEPDAAVALTIASQTIRLLADDCAQPCQQQVMQESAAELKQHGLNRQQAEAVLDGLAESASLPVQIWPGPREQLLAGFTNATSLQPVATKKDTTTQQTQSQGIAAAGDNSAASQQQKAWYMPSPQTHSILQWVQGILSDIGIGFGWAAAYFTLTVAWCHGQTLGKRLFGIKVIQLDGKELSLITAFSRQGGYGAGFATGLLGFAQVLWDPNRQAIQDKVASTVVIRLHQPKRPLTH